jgi:hypothetical protein
MSLNLHLIANKIKSVSKKDLFCVFLLILVSTSSFAIDRLSYLESQREKILFENNNKKIEWFVASKTGSRYFFPWCGGAMNIKEENKVWFFSRIEAEKNGFLPAENCPGLIEKL